MTHILAYTHCDVQLQCPNSPVYKVFWPWLPVEYGIGQKIVNVVSNDVQLGMQVHFLTDNGKSCLCPVVVRNVSALDIVQVYVKRAGTYVQALKADDSDSLYMQTKNMYGTDLLGIKNNRFGPTMPSSLFLRGESLCTSSAFLKGVGRIALLPDVSFSTYRPLNEESTFALFEQMSWEKNLPLQFYLHFELVHSAQIPLAYTTNTELTDQILNLRVVEEEAEIAAKELQKALLETPAIEVQTEHVNPKSKKRKTSKVATWPDVDNALVDCVSMGVYTETVPHNFFELDEGELGFFDE